MEITLNRGRLQEVHEVLKNLSDRHSLSPFSDKVLVRAETGRVSIVATNGDTDILYQTVATGNQTTGQCLVPLAMLADLAKGKEASIQLSGETAAQADIEKYPVIGIDGPKRFHHADWPVLRQHLRNAGDVAAANPDRYAINRLCLRQEGVVATDGRQLYAGNSLHLPVRKGQTCLVVPSKIFASKTLGSFTRVGLARDDAGLSFKFGDAWTIRLRNQDGRFPSWEKLVPKVDEAISKLVVLEARLPEMMERLGRLLEGTGPETTVRLNLGPKPTLTALDKDEKEVRSVELPEASSIGEPLTLAFDPKYLLTALKMGFLTVHFTATNRPILATKGSDLYLWMPCVEESAAPAAAGQPSPVKTQNTPMPRKSRTAKTQAPQSDLDAILGALDALRDGLRDLSVKVASVKQAVRQRAADLQKREKAVQQALASLKQLKNLGA